MVRKSRFKRFVCTVIIFAQLVSLICFMGGNTFAAAGECHYGEVISGNVVSAEDKKTGNDRWSADRSVTLSEGTLWWVQYHNPLRGGNLTSLNEPAASMKYFMFTSGESTEYVYYRTVGMRFTLEEVSAGDGEISTSDMTENRHVWEKDNVRFVDVFLRDVSDSVKARTSALFGNGGSAGDRRRVSSSVLVTKDISGGSGVIEGHYYITDFLKRNAGGGIERNCVVGQLIEQKWGTGTLPAGKWRIYASHITEIMTAERTEQENGTVVLSNRRERLVSDGAGNLVPDVRTTLVDVLEAARWSGVTRDEYLPALFNRYIDIPDEKLVSTTVVVQYYRSGTDPVRNILKTEIRPLDEKKGVFSGIDVSYERGEGRPQNLGLVLSEAGFASGTKVFDEYEGLRVYAGDRPDSYGEAGTIGTGNVSFKTEFMLSGTPQKPVVIPRSIIDRTGQHVNVATPYICVWVPLKSRVRVTCMYVESDESRPVLVHELGMREPAGGTSERITISRSDYAGSEVVARLSDPMQTSDAAEYEISESGTDAAVRYFYGTDGWDIESSSALPENSIASVKRTVNSLMLTGLSRDGRRYGVMGQGTGNTASFASSPFVTDVVFFVRVAKKKPPIETRKLYIRYVPANGQTHILRDVGPIAFPAGGNYTYVHETASEVEWSGICFEPALDLSGCERPLLGVWTDESEKLPLSYKNAVKNVAGGSFSRAEADNLGQGRIKIVIPDGARDAMLFIPYEEKTVVTPGADINIYYIKAAREGAYRVIAAEKRVVAPQFYEEAQANGTFRHEFTLRTEVVDPSSGAFWRAVDEPGTQEYGYAVVASLSMGESIGDMRYPGAFEDGWTNAPFDRSMSEGSMSMGIMLSGEARTYEVFIPCALKTGNNPIRFFAIDASTGKLLKREPVATSFMEGSQYLVCVSDCEEFVFGERTYVMLGEKLEADGLYPFATSAFAYRGFVTTAVPSAESISSNIVRPIAETWDVTEHKNTPSEFRSRYIYVSIEGLSVPSGNVIAVYIPYRTASQVNVFLITDEKMLLDLEKGAAVRNTYHVSRSYWVDDKKRPLEEGTEEENGDGGGWFDFEVPTEICDESGTPYYMTDDEPVALHHDEFCDGIYERTGLCAAPCPMCAATGMTAVHGRAGAAGVKGKCPQCDGSGILITAMNYTVPERETLLSDPGTQIMYRCTVCGGTGLDPTLSGHAHEKKKCPECNPDGNGPRTSCPSCSGRGQSAYSTWEDASYVDENGVYYSSSRLVVRFRTCDLCGGSGSFSCKTCDGSGWIDGDLCTHCCSERLYSALSGMTNTVRSVITYGTGYTVRRRRICGLCGGTGICGGAPCYCTRQSYIADPDIAAYDRNYSRGSSYDVYYNGEYTTHRDHEGFMYGGYRCTGCNAFILATGFGSGTRVICRKDENGRYRLEFCGSSGLESSESYRLFDTKYRSVSFEDETHGRVDAGSACRMAILRNRKTYNEALLDTAERTAVRKKGGTDPVALSVYVPTDHGTKTTDVYILYTEWQAFSMPEPQPRVFPPEPYERMEDVVRTDTDGAMCDVRIVAGENGGVDYDPSLSIPSARNLRLEAKGRKYLCDMTLSNTVGVLQIPVTVRYPYAFYESAAAYRRGDEPVASGYAERVVNVVRPYSFWTVEKFAVWSLREAGASTNVLKASPEGCERIVAAPGTDTVPAFSVERLGGLVDHIPNLPSSEEIVLTVDGFYADIFRNGAAPAVPELDEGYAEQLAYGAAPELTVLDDTLVFEGEVILGGSGALMGGSAGAAATAGNPGKTAGPTGILPQAGEVLTFFSVDRRIPVEKKNGNYPVVAATVSYGLAQGSVGLCDETKYLSTGLPAPVVVQTPVYVRGSLRMTDPSYISTGGAGILGNSNTVYVQEKDADTSQIWAVLGEERAYEGYDPSKASETFRTCDLFACLSNTADVSHPHLPYPGYGVRTFDSDIFTPSAGELPYNRISSDIRIVVDRSLRAGQISWEPDYIENCADVVLEAGEWLTVPADTVIRFIVPRDTREGRHYITFASVAANKEDPEDTLSTAMQIANTYCLSHAVYDRKYFNVVGRLWGLTLESTSLHENNGRKAGVGDKSAAGLVLADPPGSFFPATEKDGVRAGVTACFSIVSDGVRANSEILKGLSFSPKIYYVPYDTETGELRRDKAVEADLWYDPGPYTGLPGLTRFEPEILFTPLIDASVRDQLKPCFSLFIPAGLRVTAKGTLSNTPKSVGFTSSDRIWLKNGVIVITFDPCVNYRIADRTVTVGYDCGPADMWALEGCRDSAGFRKGDVLAFDLSSDIRDAFFVDHLN